MTQRTTTGSPPTSATSRGCSSRTSGRTIEATETQTTQPEVTEAKIGETRAPRLGPRVGFLVPEPFGYPGEYTFSISQDGYDDVVYVLDVKPSEDTEEVADGEVH
jgi:hypothetical protein